MKIIYTIAERELKSLFLSPVAWTILGILQLIFAYLFFSQIDAFINFQAKLAGIENAPGITDVIIVPLYTNAALILLLVTPLLTMRLISEERRNKTLVLLLSAPVSNYQIIFGKYLSIVILLLTIISLLTLMSLSLLIGSQLDIGKFISNILALILVSFAFAALGLYMSCLTQQPTIAAISSFGVLLLLWVLNASASLQNKSGELFDYLSLLKHFQRLQNGLLNTADLAYFLLFTATFIMLSIYRLEHDRLQK